MSSLSKSLIVLLSVFLSTLPLVSQDCDALYPDPLIFNQELVPGGPYMPGDPVEMILSVENFEDILTFAFEIQWDPTILCLNTDTLQFNNPQVVPGFPNSLFTSADLNTELEMVANSGKMSIGFFDDVAFTGATQPDGTQMIRILFNACGEMDCATINISSGFDNNVIRNNEGLGIQCPDTVLFITEPTIDEACIICGTEPTLIDRNICKNPDGSLNLSFSACGMGPFTWDIIGFDSGTIAAAGDLVTVVLPASNTEYGLEILDVNGTPIPGNLGFGIELIDPDNFDPLTINAFSDPDPLACSNARASINYTVAGGNTQEPGATVDRGLYDLFLSDGTTRLNAESSGVFTQLTAGTYTLTALDKAGCEVSTIIDITSPPPITFEVEVDSSTCVGADDWEVRIIPSGGTPDYGLGGATMLTDTIVIPGFTLFGEDSLRGQFFDANGCVTNYSVFIPVGDSFDFIHSLIPTVCGENMGWTSRVDLPNSIYNSSLRNDDTNTQILTGGNNTFQQATNIETGNYTWFVQDLNTDCTVEFEIFVPNTIPPRLLLTDNSTQPNCGLDDGIALVDAMGGSGNFMYNWEDFPGETNNSISPVAAGEYIVTVTDIESGCFEVITLDLLAGDFLTIEPVVRDSLQCDDPSVIAVLSAGINSNATDIMVTWTNANGDNVGDSALLRTTDPGLYTVVVSINGGACTVARTVQLDSPSGFDFDLSKVEPQSCPDDVRGEVFVENLSGGSGNYSYAWEVELSAGGTFELMPLMFNEGVVTFANILVSGNTFTVTIEDTATGCKTSKSITLMSDDEVMYTSMVTSPTCPGDNDGTVQIIGSNLVCLDQDGMDIPGCIFIGNSGEYIFTIMDGICSATDTFLIEDVELFTADINVSVDPNCFGGTDGNATVEITTNPSNITEYSYSWNGGATELNGLFDTELGLSGGENFVVIGDANACTDTVRFTLTEPDSLFFNDLMDVAVNCRGFCDGTIELDPRGGTTPNGIYTYMWEDGMTSRTRNDLCAGTYIVTLTDSNFCTHIDSFMVVEPDTITVDTLITNVGCSDSGLGGSITLNPTGGCEGFTYLWPANESMTNVATGLDVGNYSISITDACGCETIIDAEVSGSNQLTATALDATQIQCAGELVCIGVDSSSVSGGTGIGYTYSINFGNRIPIDSCVMVAPGQYFLTVFDSEGCSFELPEVIIDTEPEYNVDLGPDIEGEVGSGEIILTANITSSFAISDIEWESLDSFTCLNPTCDSIEIMAINTSAYSVTVTDVNGCTAVDEININLDSPRRTYVPTFFIAGSSNAEDRVMIQTGRGVDRVVDFLIYDRWGNVVFELPEEAKEHPTSRDDGWDGTRNGQDVEQGVYVWIANVRYVDGLVLATRGQITLLRED
jgi:hypothetical protein